MNRLLASFFALAAPLAALTPLAATAQALPASRAGDARVASPSEACADEWRAPLAALVGRSGDAPRYAALQSGGAAAQMRAAVACVEATDVSTLRTDAQRLAFWLNAYNIQMVQNVLGAPGTRQVLDQRDAFFRTPRRFAGRALTLDDVENGILRRQTAGLRALSPSRLDARLHAGLFCGAVSCPPLQARPFTAATVEADLDAAARAWVTSSRFARVSGRTATLSSLVDWFGTDFDGAAGGKAGDFFARYLPATSPLRTRLAGKTAAQIKAAPGTTFAYDWALARR